MIQRFEKISGIDFYDKEQLPICKRRSDFVAPAYTHPTIQELVKLREDFLSKMDDDFNTGGATGDLFEMVRALNRFIDSEGLEEPAKRTADTLSMLSIGMTIFKEMSSILGIFVRPPKQSGGNEDATQLLDGLMQLVIQLRSDARAKRDFATSDSVRNGLTQIGITLQDGKNGTTWEVNK